MTWLVFSLARRAPRRLLLAALAVAFPVAVLSATLLFVDDSVHSMTRRALEPVQVDMRALATTLDTDMASMDTSFRTVSSVATVDPFGAASVVIATPGAPTRLSARLVAVEPAYFEHHSWSRALGDISKGALLSGGIVSSPGFENAKTISIELRNADQPLGLDLPVAGQLDTRHATTWFQIPAGGVQGDLAVLPRTVAIDYATFARVVLPALQRVFGGPAAVTNPGLSELPPASIEAHITIATGAYPADPGQAAAWSSSLRRVLERRAAGNVIVADNAFEPLTEAATDATSAKVLFFLLGIPGALVAAALGIAAASALAESHRREDALLRLRGATDGQLIRLAAGQGLLAAAVGLVVGLAVAVAGVSALIGHPAWRNVPALGQGVILLAAIAAAGFTTIVRLVTVVRTGRESQLAIERRLVARKFAPKWLRARWDIVLLMVGAAILGLNLALGGLRLPMLDTNQQPQALALSFYVLLAPVTIWAGGSLLLVRLLLRSLSRASRPERSRPLTSWRSAALRWLGRRPARTAVALSLGILAVAFGTNVLTFNSTYAAARHADERAAFGSDLRLEPATDRPVPLPALGGDVAATTPVRLVPARAGSDRKTIAAIDPGSYRHAMTATPTVLDGAGLPALASSPMGVIVSKEFGREYDVKVGDTVPVTIFPDDLDLSQKLNLKVVGVFRSFPPDVPFSEMIISSSTIPAPVPAPDFYLARVASGRKPDLVASELRGTGVEQTFTVHTARDLPAGRLRSLTSLNLHGLSVIEETAALLIAALGVGVLGAYLVLERRREYAILQTVGATKRQLLLLPTIEGAAAAVGSVLLGIPLGIGVAILAIRVLGIFFTLPPPLVRVPFGSIGLLALGVLTASAIALAIVLRRVSRDDVSPQLREP